MLQTESSGIIEDVSWILLCQEKKIKKGDEGAPFCLAFKIVMTQSFKWHLLQSALASTPNSDAGRS